MAGKGLTGWVAAFKVGKHSGKGKLASHTFSRDDLDEMVANLSAENPVPHVITHDKLYSPFAYAHGIEAKRDDDTLFVRSEKINPDFDKLVKSGALFNRSIRAIKDPIKGWCLDHIAWLGAEPPAVEGLAAVQYSKDAEYCDFQFVDTQTPYSLKRMARSIRTFLIDKFDKATADQVIPEHEIDDLEWNKKQADKAADDNKNTEGGISPVNFNKPTGDNSVTLKQADLDKAKQEGKDAAQADFQKKLDKQQADFDAQFAKTQKKEWDARVASAIKKGTLTPAQAEGMTEFAMSLPSDAFVEFSRDDKDKTDVKVPANVWFADFVSALPKQVAMASNASGGSGGAGDELDNTDASAIAAKAVEFQKAQAGKGITVSTAQAVVHVTTNEGEK